MTNEEQFGDAGRSEDGEGAIAPQHTGQKRKFTLVFKLLLIVVTMCALTCAVAIYSAFASASASSDAKDAAEDTQQVVDAFSAQSSPAAIQERRNQIDEIITDIEGRIDCNEYDRWISVTSSLEDLLDLPKGSIKVKRCVRVTSNAPNATTTTTPAKTPPTTVAP